MQHYIDETTLQVYGYKANDACVPCEMPQPHHDWDTVTKEWIPDTATIEAEEAKAIQDELINAVQAKLDSEAQAVGYDNILSACSYAGFTNPFEAEGQSFVAWRGSVWAYCYEQLALVEAGTRTLPTPEELVAELPLRA